MDKEYLQNISNSPYMEEGAFDRTLARGKAGWQRATAVMGGRLSELNYTKIESLFNTFKSRVSSILKDFDEVGTRLEQMRPRPTPEQRAVIMQLKDLYSIFSPTPFQQHQYGQMNPPRWVKESTVFSDIAEGVFTRDMSLNKAIQTNNPATILNAYIAQLKKMYDVFFRDAVKITNFNTADITRIVTSISPKFGKVLGEIKALADTQLTPKVATSPIATSPTAPAATSAQPAPSATPSPTPAPTAATPAAAPSDVVKSAQSIGGDGNDFAIILEHVIQIIIGVIKEDPRSEPYFSQKLPTSFDEPSVHAKPEKTAATTPSAKPTSPSSTASSTASSGPPVDYSIEEVDTAQGGSNADDEPSDEAGAGLEDFKEIPGQFLRNLHGKWRKAKHFAMEFPVEGKDTVVLSKGKTRQIRVILAVGQHENIIHLKYRSPEDPENVWKEMPLFKFWDHQADPRGNSYVGENSIYQYFHEANPYEVNILKKANPDILKHLESLNDPFNRALYAIVDRKSMEKKKEDKGQVELRLLNNSTTEGHPHYGAVEKLNGKDAGIKLKAEVLAKYHSADDTERFAWRNALDEIEYFDNLPDIKEEIEQTETKITAATSKYRITYPMVDKDTATLVIRNVAIKLGPAIINMTADQLYDAAIKEEAKNPDANIAKETLVKTGWKPKDAQYYVTQAKEQLGPSAGSEAYMRKAKELKASVPPEATTLQMVQNAIAGLEELGYKKADAKKAILKVARELGTNLSDEDMIKAALKLPKEIPVEPQPAEVPIKKIATKVVGKMYEAPSPDKKSTILVWETPKQGIQQYSQDEVKKMMADPQKYKNFNIALRKFPDLYKKYGGKVDEGFINPFQMDNFL